MVETFETGWKDRAVCKGHGHLFFGPYRERMPSKGARERAALRMCAACPVVRPCRAEARATRAFGTWGGETEGMRTAAGFAPELGVTAHGGPGRRALRGETIRRLRECREGDTVQGVADELGVSTRTILRWQAAADR